jgi:hypothetical protein
MKVRDNPIQTAALTKRIGLVGEGSPGDPYNPFPPAQDLREGHGTPPGFEARVFSLSYDHNDPRITGDGFNLIARALRANMTQWLREKCHSHKNWACRTPKCFVTEAWVPEEVRTVITFRVEAYVYPPLEVEVEETPR